MRIGTIIGGKYEILKKLGEGGMSIVYLAMDMRLNKQWAIKEIKKGNHCWDNNPWKALQMEANVLKIVDHPVLPRIVDVIETSGTLYVVMDYIEGRPISVVLKEEGAQSQEKVLGWAKELCSALDYLHSLQPPIIYRDMKPSNIMLKPDGRVKLIDFGTAKELDVESLADTVALGTKGYAAPEQFGDVKGRGINKTDARTDIYNLGATIYHLVTGKSPGEPPYEMEPIRYWDRTLSGGLEKIIQKCTMADPKKRYQSCRELMYDLEHFKELDEAFRRICFLRMKSFLVTVLLAICCTTLSVVGYVGCEWERNNDYESLIRQGFDYTIQGRYEEAASTYIYAITEVDGSRNTAYMELMDLYTNYMEDVEVGIEQVAYYIDQKYQNIHRDQELLLKVAMEYFEVQKDYKSSAYYFNMLDDRKYPEAKYYTAIAVAMTELNVDYNSLLDHLVQFETINDSRTDSVHKLMNYRLLCIVYARSLKQMDVAAKRLIQVADKGLQRLEDYEEHGVKAEYYIIYNQYLSVAYEHLGEELEETDEEQSTAYYEKALESCDVILGMLGADGNETIESLADYRLKEAKYCQKASIYEALHMYDKACEIYEKGEEEYKGNSISLYVGHMTLLCKMEELQNADVERWDYDRLYGLYKEGMKVKDMEQDYRWKCLTQKLAPLFEENGS